MATACGGVTDRHVAKPYADFLAACGKLYLEQSSYGNMEEWANNPIHGLSFEKSPNGSSTSVIVRCTRSATANDLVDETAALLPPPLISWFARSRTRPSS